MMRHSSGYGFNPLRWMVLLVLLAVVFIQAAVSYDGGRLDVPHLTIAISFVIITSGFLWALAVYSVYVS